MTDYKKIYLIAFLAGLYLLSSCGPVNFLTRAKKIPQNYSINYNYGNLKAEHSELNDKVWIVYSDRKGNSTTVNPGGSLQLKELGFMDPFLVIGRKGDYYKLVKYDPAILKNDKLAKRKEAEYYGWIHKNLLLLFNNPVTEVRNDVILKGLTTITDCSVILDAGKYFSDDSLKLFSNPKLTDVCGSVALHSVVYTYKTDEFGTRLLVSPKAAVNPDDLENFPVGWVDASLVSPFGQRLVLNDPQGNMAVTGTSNKAFTPVNSLAGSPASISPALYTHRVDSSLVFRTLAASDILDHSDNRIYNVNGLPITFDQAAMITSDLKKINVVFGIMPTGNVMYRLPVISNAVQNLQSVFTASPKEIKFSYAAVIGGETIGFENDYRSFADKFIEVGISINDTLQNDYETILRKSLSLAVKDTTATHIIILAGDRAAGWDGIPEDIKRDVIRSNTRLLSYQVYAGNEDASNNFVLRSLDIIEDYAGEYRTLKRDKIVYTDQLRPENRFHEGEKNTYSLDFPTRSMTQGMVIFPEKGKYVEPDLLIAGVDTIVKQVVADNLNLANSIHRAFEQMGHHRSRFHKSIATHLDIDPQTRIAQYLGAAFRESSPQWVQVSDKITLPINSANMSNVGLLLTGPELEGIKNMVDKLASMKPDVKGGEAASQANSRHVRNVRRDLRGIHPDFAPAAAQVQNEISADPSGNVEYASTKAIRRNLSKIYRKALKNYILEGSPRNMTLAQAQEFITTMPTLSPILNKITIRDLGNKNRLSDAELDLLIGHFDKHKQLIQEKAIPVDDLANPAGEEFFFLPLEAMP